MKEDLHTVVSQIFSKSCQLRDNEYIIFSRLSQTSEELRDYCCSGCATAGLDVRHEHGLLGADGAFVHLGHEPTLTKRNRISLVGYVLAFMPLLNKERLLVVHNMLAIIDGKRTYFLHVFVGEQEDYADADD